MDQYDYPYYDDQSEADLPNIETAIKVPAKQSKQNHFKETDDLVETIAFCKKPMCSNADLECLEDLIDGTICEALKVIESDPRGLFCYKFPKNLYNFTANELTSPPAHSSEVSSDFVQQWLKISDFEYSNVLAVIRDFIGKWLLSPSTKCIVLTNPRMHEVPMKGKIYFVDAHFSRPSQSCPNPLAVAKVRFIITVSTIMQSHYPVMITYRFEGYRTLYYAVGDRAIALNTFQRYYIDTILHSKLSFYAEICACRHGNVASAKNKVMKTQKLEK